MTGVSPRARAELALVGVTIIWGATFVVVKNALDGVSTLLFLALRFSLGTVALFLIFRVRGALAAPSTQTMRATLRGGVLAGICLFLGYFTQTLGLRYTTPSKSAFITGLTTALVPFLAALVYRNAPHIAEMAGALLATIGLGLLTLHPGSLALGYGDALTLCCSIAFAFHILVLARWSPRSSLPWLSMVQIGITALLAAATSGWAETPYIRWSPPVMSAIVITGLLATALAFTVQTWAQSHTTPTRAGLIFALEPVSAAITSFLVAGEVLSGRALAGAALILAGIVFVELKPIGGRQHPSG